MTHLEERLERSLDDIRRTVGTISADVETALQNALDALLRDDRDRAYEVVLGDHPINRAVEQLDESVHYFVAKFLPSAGHLRMVSSVLRISAELERIGDYAVNIAKETAALQEPLKGPLAAEVERMGRDALDMFRQAMSAFTGGNAELARSTMASAKVVDRDFSVAFGQLVSQSSVPGENVEDVLGKLVILYMLERVSDRAKNLCEETVFALTGQTKQRRPMRILFLDERNDVSSQMAAAIGRRSHPQSGLYESAGRAPVKSLDGDFIQFMADNGHRLDCSTRGIDWRWEELKEFDVIVGLQGPVSTYLERIPFHTVALEWSPPPPAPIDASRETKVAAFDSIYRYLSPRVSDLMETVRGKEVV
jgi:phosphate transport system protein